MIDCIPLGTVRQNKPYLPKVAFVRVLYHSNRKVSDIQACAPSVYQLSLCTGGGGGWGGRQQTFYLKYEISNQLQSWS